MPIRIGNVTLPDDAAGVRIGNEDVGGLKIGSDVVWKTPSQVRSHTFPNISPGTPFGQASWRGWMQADARNSNTEQGSLSDPSFTSPDGVARNLQFLIIFTPTTLRIEVTDLTPEAQMPDRIVCSQGSNTITFGNATGYADRFGAQMDYSRVSGIANAFQIFDTSFNDVSVTFEWD